MGDSVRANGGRWGRRTIRAGHVRWCGRDYMVSDGPGRPLVTADEAAALSIAERTRVDVCYDGRLDGLRALFSTYGPTAPELADSVFLHSFGDDWPGPNCLDGVFRWERWRDSDSGAET